MEQKYQTDNYKVLVAQHIKAILKQEIKGSINTHIVEETLIVDIYAVNNIVFRSILRNLSEQIVHGLSSEMVAKNIVKQYRAYIRNLFFCKF